MWKKIIQQDWSSILREVEIGKIFSQENRFKKKLKKNHPKVITTLS